MTNKTPTMSRQLVLGLIIILLGVVSLLFTAGTYFFDRSLRGVMAGILQQDTDSILQALIRRQGELKPDTHRLDTHYLRPFSGHYYHIHIGADSSAREWRSRSLWDTDLPMPGQRGLYPSLVTGPLGQTLLIMRSDFRRFGTPIVIVTARDYSDIINNFLDLGRLLALVTVMGVGLLILFQRLVVKRSLIPLERMASDIAAIQAGERNNLSGDAPQELVPLQDEINRLLTHTRKVVEQNRHAVSDLGHSLKTPLAVLSSLAESQEAGAIPSLQGKMREQLEQMRERVERVLNRARMAHGALPGDFFIPKEDLAALCDTLSRIHGHGRHITCDIACERPLPLDRNDMLELLGNLLDNACKWARQDILLSLSIRPEGLEVLIEDDGPGIPEEVHLKILSRGIRLDETVAGHGLGLGIVSDIVRHYEGSLTFDRSRLGGLQVRLLLPLLLGSLV